jgi:hypothetical protein
MTVPPANPRARVFWDSATPGSCWERKRDGARFRLEKVFHRARLARLVSASDPDEHITVSLAKLEFGFWAAGQ